MTVKRPMPSHFGAKQPPAGTFKATCNLARALVVADLPEYLRREYAEKGWTKTFRHVYDRKLHREVSREVFLEPLCQGFETTDRAAFEDHMRTVHGKTPISGANASLTRAASGKWRTPPAKPEGTPLVKAAAALVQTCPTCGLVSEIGHTAADELWWREHTERCIGTQQIGAAS